MGRFKQHFEQSIVPVLQRELGRENRWQVPRLEKVVLNIGLSSSSKDPRALEHAAATLRKISGQQPAKTLAKRSISNFKIRQGQVVGLMVTLRGQRMYDFVDKLIHVTLPRVRDFRGLNHRAIDAQGNLSLGLRENLAFPEITADDVELVHGVQVTVVSSAGSRQEGELLFQLLGFPFRGSARGQVNAAAPKAR